MLPEAKADKLLYISDASNGTVTVYAYPEGRLVGTLTGFGPSVGPLLWQDRRHFCHGLPKRTNRRIPARRIQPYQDSERR
jgi:hypothetical protein